jgi:hypothetical protein
MNPTRWMLAATVVIAGSASSLLAQPLQISPSPSPSGRAARPVPRKKIARDPTQCHGYNEMAMALTQRTRETGDPAFHLQADATVTTSLTQGKTVTKNATPTRRCEVKPRPADVTESMALQSAHAFAPRALAPVLCSRLGGRGRARRHTDR